MALVTIRLSEYNSGLNHVDLTYDNVTLAVSSVAWTNPVGHWTWTITRPGQPDIVQVLAPGDTGSRNVPAGYAWQVAKTDPPPNFGYADSWTRA